MTALLLFSSLPSVLKTLLIVFTSLQHSLLNTWQSDFCSCGQFIVFPKYVEILTPIPVNVTSLGNQVFEDEIKMVQRSYWIRVGLKPSNWYPSKNVMWRHNGTETNVKKTTLCRWKQRLESCNNKPRSAKDCWQAPKARKRQGGPSVYMALPTPRFQTPIL